MRPADLTASDFKSYPVLARGLATSNLLLLRQLPLIFLGLLLSEMIGYDWRFPIERAEIDRQLHRLSSASAAALSAWMTPFARLPLDASLYREPWAANPMKFVEKLTAYLWTVHAIDSFRQVAKSFGDSMQVQEDSAPPRWCVVVVGRDATRPLDGLFQQLKSKGTRFTNVDPTGGWPELLRFLQARVRSEQQPYRHWYVDGGAPSEHGSQVGLCTVSYEQLGPLREAILQRMNQASSSGTVGPESLRSLMAQMRPADLRGVGLPDADPVLADFQLSLLTEGSGTQIFSTTFVQWAGREILRRAQPATLLMRYAPRQADRPMNDLLLPTASPTRIDPEGSLLDASMGAYYTWLGLQHLAGAQQSRFLAWRESGNEAVVIAPGMAKGGLSTQPCNVAKLLSWMA